MKKRQILVRDIYYYHINSLSERNKAHRGIYSCRELYSCVLKSKGFDIGELMPLYYSFIHLPAGQK